MARTVIFDLDGTLANIDHRREFVSGKKKNFDKFFLHINGDSVNAWCRELMLALGRRGIKIVIVSARPQRLMEDTKRWLSDNKVYYDTLVHVRSDKDYSPDSDLKRAWLKNRGKEGILFVVDDRRRVVDMWRSEGLVCLQCDDWEEKSRPVVTEKGESK